MSRKKKSEEKENEQRNNESDIEFVNEEDATVSEPEEIITDKEVEEQEANKKKKGNKKPIYITILIILVLVLGVLIYCFWFMKPGKPVNVSVENSEFRTIEVSWDPVEDVSNYEVIFSTNEFTSEEITSDVADGVLDGDYEVISVQEINKTTIDTVLSNSDYYLLVIGYSNEGEKEYFEPSDVVKFHTDSLKITPIDDLHTFEVTNNLVTLMWTAYTQEVTNLDGTDIEISYAIYATNNTSEEESLVSSGIENTEFTIENLMPATKYYYKIIVTAIVDGKEVSSDESEWLEVTTKYDPVTGISAKAAGTSSLTITWDAYDKIEEASITYSVYAANSIDSEYKLIADELTDTTYTETDLIENKIRFYYVVANFTIDGNDYETTKSEIVNATTDKKTYTTGGSSSSGSSGGSSNGGSSSGGLTSSQKEAQARVIARQIANSITGSTDLEKVMKAAEIVYDYTENATYTTKGNDYYTAYGVFIKGEFSCAGTARALGMVLEEMGYQWTHINPNQWTHQWVELTMDGREGWADAMLGYAGYGEYPKFFWGL